MAIKIAVNRYKNARQSGKPNLKMGDQSNLDTDLNGIGGEIAACRYFGVYPDTETSLVNYPKYDLKTKKGAKVDVKTTPCKTGKLLATLKKQIDDCDIYLLVIGEFPTYEIKGFAESSQLINDENIINLGHGEGYALTQDKLKLI